MKKLLIWGMLVMMLVQTIVFTPVVSACDKCKEKAPDSCGDGCLLPDE